MATRSITLLFGLTLISIAGATASAQALTMKECSAKYKAAQAAGTAKGMKWNDFRKAECGSDATATPAGTTAPAPVTPPKAAKKEASPSAPPSAPPAAPVATGNAIFPNAVSPKYSGETAGKARMHTCLDQYNANKANNGNGGLKWIEKGGGYYSECNKRLKG
jgi:uncharacterized membrane protein